MIVGKDILAPGGSAEMEETSPAATNGGPASPKAGSTPISASRLLVEAVAKGLSLGGVDVEALELCRAALGVLSFIATAGEPGVATLLAVGAPMARAGLSGHAKRGGISDVLSDRNPGASSEGGPKSLSLHQEQAGDIPGRPTPAWHQGQRPKAANQQPRSVTGDKRPDKSADGQRISQNVPSLLVGAVNAALTGMEGDSESRIDREAFCRATIVREGMALLCTLAAHRSFGAATLGFLTSTRKAARACMNMSIRIAELAHTELAKPADGFGLSVAGLAADMERSGPVRHEGLGDLAELAELAKGLTRRLQARMWDELEVS